MSEEKNVIAHSFFTDFDISLFSSGKHFKLWEKMGNHLCKVNNQNGVYFAVWAPNAANVSVVGDFNSWNSQSHKLYPRWDHSGIWEGFIPGLKEGQVYKYAIQTKGSGMILEKGDPFAGLWEVPPKTASVISSFKPKWSDGKWMRERKKKNGLEAPISVYEVHLGSWKRKFEEQNRSLSYQELAKELVPYVKEMGFTHVEFMPVMEHPFFGSWGYQVTGYFAPSSRYGTPEDFALLVNEFHKAGIGVYLDWVPSHFPNDAHGLFRFDGTSLYEHEDPRQGYHPDWNSYIFNYGRNEVRSFLISNALYWLEQFHADGLRVDAVASMLYLDYSRKEGEWVPNKFGGRENLEAISFLKELNEVVYKEVSGIQMIAEESTSWPMVTKPTDMGGLGFGMKWMMGWMNDVLEYVKLDPIYRKYHQNQLTFSLMYAFTENFMLPLSHDEVVHGKGSILSRMPGDEWRKFANLRALYSWMFTHPGTKLLFMGDEFGQYSEWKHDEALLWNLLNFEYHKGISQLVQDLNELYTSRTELYDRSFTEDGFEWIDYGDSDNTVVVFNRIDNSQNRLIIVGNFSPISHEIYSIGVKEPGTYNEIFNSDEEKYGGSGVVNREGISSTGNPIHGQAQSISLRIPPLGFTILEKA
jgi:1,4-alpha-glucan branching enzyme